MSDKVIYKYEIIPGQKESIQLPADAKILCVHEQDGNPHVWVEIDLDKQSIERVLFIIGTGWRGNHIEDNDVYLGTAFCDGLVWHVYERR